ncbi:hypothetical protein [Caniella muris]|uniref:hypothetical protein n=1 Tax=Caniella muris TaxID=2941502 RepID=UPI00203B22C1|nr:hypothetical protein [Caniella muris]
MATISARVPDEVRRQGLSRLRAQGATVSDLVNAAFDYLIQTGELPGRPSKVQGRRGPLGARALSPAQADELRRSLEATTFPDAVPADGGNYKAALAEGRRRDYEALS